MSALPAADGFALQLDEIPNVEPMRFWVTVRNRFENDPGEIAEGHFCVEDGVLVVTDWNERFVGSATLRTGEDVAHRARHVLLADAAQTGFNAGFDPRSGIQDWSK